jgi:hypothetical protein
MQKTVKIRTYTFTEKDETKEFPCYSHWEETTSLQKSFWARWDEKGSLVMIYHSYTKDSIDEWSISKSFQHLSSLPENNIYLFGEDKYKSSKDEFNNALFNMIAFVAERGKV